MNPSEIEITMKDRSAVLEQSSKEKITKFKM